ncbi:UDP-N-acetylmuramate: L-alanyl-gamma-D-glutamyl-meso-diaminopimelate ligase [Pseudarcicella hirudinis]|uniref:UDP-N-acetylmuramate: L-alanyl-gamma-D-glutamyl-meso-diaminopimelate ligase n=2 Tax=Pseudarcicella hirudinis TaxID=1079859 RepID=A0A1I5WR82_9BACT|nr:Mur ligase family protein [Pseudarcicella hirudinis]SFQ22305.1 UDP-N-acetylmuramate: L-alanyl-gamma-D-glutamyl-meso-diaminopimelate ligase [Pseudarcicella hirudinis]
MTAKNIHFIAIGGAAMHNLAIVLHNQGHNVTGSDDEIYEPSRTLLAEKGLLPAEIGWFPEKITSKLDYVVLGMHARIDNPELIKAQEAGIKIYSYPEFIYSQSEHKHRVVIAGSHGKTTITSMILHVLKYHKRKFDYMVGARIEGFDTMASLSNAPLIVIEGDEYLSSPIDRRPKFIHYHPHVALISGIAWDHINVYPEFDQYVHQFELLADLLPKAGSLVYDSTDKLVSKIGKNLSTEIQGYDYQAHPNKIRDGKTYLITAAKKEVEVSVFGEHNMKNINGAKLVLSQIGIEEEEFYEAIPSFKGAAKRLEFLGGNEETVIYKDFAHAPSKVEATTKAVKEQFPKRKLIACLELHTFSSLNKSFLPEYANKLNAADLPVVFYSPHTLEHKKLPAISAEDIQQNFNNKNLQVFTNSEELQSFLLRQNWKDTNLLMMTSGTFDGLDFKALASKIL